MKLCISLIALSLAGTMAAKTKDIICYRGNMKQYPVALAESPPCWYKEKDGSYSCYEYEAGTIKCPFAGSIKKPKQKKSAKNVETQGRNHVSVAYAPASML